MSTISKLKMSRVMPWILALAWACGSSSPGKNDTPFSRSGPLPLPAGTVLPTDVTNGIAIGAISGEASVNSDGSASYSIPLWTPPGRAGMAPSLSLDYNSRGTSGALGVGWSLGGIPRITRCRKTIAAQGVAEPISYSDSDSFCFGGQPLVLVKGSGLAGSEYRTEYNSFTKVVMDSYDGAPVSFVAYMSDGRIYRFAEADVVNRVQITSPPYVAGALTTPPNTILLETPAMRFAWGLSVVSDRFGNEINISYTHNAYSPYGPATTAQTMLPDTITYTGGATTGIKTVKFGYAVAENFSARTAVGYEAGVTRQDHWLLSTVTMSGPSPDASNISVLRKYQLSYTGDNRSLAALNSVTMLDGAGVAMGSTAFLWNYGELQGSPPYLATNTNINDFSTNAQFRWLVTGDFDGDGYDDLLYVQGAGQGEASNEYAVRFSNGADSFGAPVATNLMTGGNSIPPAVVDRDGDGKADLLVYTTSANGQISPCFFKNKTASDGLSPYPVVSFVIDQCMGSGTSQNPLYGFAADFDGDGITDGVSHSDTADSSQWFPFFSSGYGYENQLLPQVGPQDIEPSLIGPNYFALDVQDVDGSGKQKLIGWPGNNATRRASYDYTLQNVSPVDNHLPPDWGLSWADINGDGLGDAVTQSLVASEPGVAIAFNTGNGFAENNGGYNVNGDYQFFLAVASEEICENNLTFDCGMRFFDWDGDGRSDALVRPGHVNGDGTGATVKPYMLVLNIKGMNSAGLVVSESEPIASVANVNDVGFTRPLDINGDGMDDLVYMDNGKLVTYVHQGGKPWVLTDVIDGHGNSTAFAYKSLGDRSVHSPATDCSYPTRCMTKGMWVVSQLTASDSMGVANSLVYQYSGAREDLLGRGFLGFEQTTTTNVAAHSATSSYYDLNSYRKQSFYPFVGRPYKVSTTVQTDANTQTLETVNTTWVPELDEYTGIYWVYRQGEIRAVSETTTTPASTVQISSTRYLASVDDFGNMTDELTTNGDGDVFHRQVTYSNNADSWIVQRPTLFTETSTVGGVSASQATSYAWDATTGALKQIVTDPNVQPAGQVQPLFTTFGYSSDGKLTSVVTDGNGTGAASPVTRGLSLTYDPVDGSTLSSVTDVLGHLIRWAFHPGLGVLGASDDFNGVLTTTRVDGFGRVKHADVAGGRSADVTYGATPNSPGQLRITETRDDGGSMYFDFDSFGRKINELSSTRSDGAAVLRTWHYDSLGRGVDTVTEPHFASATTPPAVTLAYDFLGRVTTFTDFSNQLTEVAYSGRQQTTTSPTGKVTFSTADQSGRITSAGGFDYSGGDVVQSTYSYGPFSVLWSLTDANGQIIQVHSDSRARAVRIVDPNAGEVDYTYNIYGEITKEDRQPGTADERIRELSYDNTGRLSQTTDHDGTNVWTWDTSANGIGLIGSTTSAFGVATTYSYDTYGRLSELSKVVGGRTYVFDQTYDALGRASQLTMPTIPNQAARYTIENLFGSKGALDGVSEFGSSRESVLWNRSYLQSGGLQTSANDSFGSVKFGGLLQQDNTESSGRPGLLSEIRTTNGGLFLQKIDVGFDFDGQLSARTDAINMVGESYEYDSLSRLSTWLWEGPGYSQTTHYAYGNSGDLLSKSVGGAPASSFTCQYDASGPDEMTAAGAALYSYNSLGQRIASANQDLTYTASDTVASVVLGQATTSFSYDVDGERVASATTTPSAKLITIGPMEVVQEGTNLAESDIFTIGAPGGSSVQVVFDVTGTKSIRYLLADHLGSTDVVASSAGAVLERMRFDPYGNRVSDTNLGQSVPLSTIGVDIGFTGQRHDTQFGWINMVGREYDPTSSRFLSRDPLLPDITSSQGMNGYAYVMNNPTNFVDPTGFDPEGELGSGGNVSNLSDSLGGDGGGSLGIPTVGSQVSMSQRDFTQKIQSFTTCSGRLGAPAGKECAFGAMIATPNGIARLDMWQPIGGNAQGSNQLLNRIGRFYARNFPNVRLNNDSKKVIEGAMILGSVLLPVLGEMRSALNASQAATAVGGASGEAAAAETAAEGGAAEAEDIAVEQPRARGGAGPTRQGLAAERRVRSVADIGDKERFEIHGRWRVADGVSDTAVSEVKDVSYQYLSRQIKDSLAFADSSGLELKLWIRPGGGTVLSRPLQRLVNAGRVVIDYIPSAP